MVHDTEIGRFRDPFKKSQRHSRITESVHQRPDGFGADRPRVGDDQRVHRIESASSTGRFSSALFPELVLTGQVKAKTAAEFILYSFRQMPSSVRV